MVLAINNLIKVQLQVVRFLVILESCFQIKLNKKKT